MDQDKEDPRIEQAKAEAAKIIAGGKAGAVPVKLFEATDRHLAHLILENLGPAFPRAECRENWRGQGEIEVWSGPRSDEEAAAV